MVRHRITGKLPEVVRPDGPLIRLLESIPPRIRSRIAGVRISPELGYHGNFMFHTAEHLLRWAKPDEYVDALCPGPAESRRDKRFQKELTLEDLKRHASSWPENYPRKSDDKHFLEK